MEILHVEAQDRARRKGEQDNEGLHDKEAALPTSISWRKLRGSGVGAGRRIIYEDIDAGHFVIYV
jgi:hypothetical protein